MDMTRVHIPNEYSHHSHHLDASKKNIKWLPPSPQHVQATVVAHQETLTLLWLSLGVFDCLCS